jgi:transposase-like protein
MRSAFGETRRRVKVIGLLPGQHSCLSLVWAVLAALRLAGADSP